MKAFPKLFACALFAYLAVWQSRSVEATKPVASDPPGRDSILDWNAIALQCVADDHSGTFGTAEQGGPTRTSRALAIVHAAMYDAANSISQEYQPYLAMFPTPGGSLDAAVAQAAHDTLRELYPNQRDEFADKLQDYLQAIPNAAARAKGRVTGKLVAKLILLERRRDGSQDAMPYTPGTDPGDHNVDPLHPAQGFLTPGWGSVTPFVLRRARQFRAPPFPALDSEEYAEAFNEVKELGGDGIDTPTLRTAEQTEIALFWAYDGARGLGVPPRLYNQIVRTVAEQEGNSEIENARLFALVNLAMADAGIAAWETKYHYNLWRPILAIRRGDEDGNADTEGDPEWSPLGAPASNQSGTNFTPPFPAYTSGHSTFGAATFKVLERFYGTDDIAFSFISDELNGVTTDWQGNVRPLAVRTFESFSQAAAENAISRIYLGIHWKFDATEGIVQGNSVGNWVFDHSLRPR